MDKKIVTFDFDATLSRPDVQEYAKELIEKGIDVWVVTARYDDLHTMAITLMMIYMRLLTGLGYQEERLGSTTYI